MMGTATRLHPDNAGRQPLRQSDQRLASDPPPHDNRAGRVEPNHTTDVLAQISAKNRDHRHSPSSFSNSSEPTTPEGGAGHSIRACSPTYRAHERWPELQAA